MNNAQPEIRTESRPNCLLCGMPGRNLYHDLPSALYEAGGQWSLSQCPNSECGLIWLNPAPVESDLHLAYANYFTHTDARGSNRLRDFLFAAYRAANFPLWLLTGVAAEKKRRRLMFLHQTSPGHLLDVGCGDGTFLSLMRQRGWTVAGIDFDPKAIASARHKFGLELKQGDLRSAAFPANQFDAVTMSHVVEHLPDPVSVLQEIRRILKPGGQLVMTTPNTAGIGHQKFGANWFGIDAPRHLHLFNRAALSQVVVRAGLKVTWAGSSSASADVFIGASYTIQENNRHRMGYHPPPNVTRTLKAAWWQIREHQLLKSHPFWGDELVLVCVPDASQPA